ncbi:DUF4197 domain-containing protein [Erythrobacter sp. SCSIO 43205]|uniref:DUF4197 domain-containing protein n=1 Tax=Erythrobacter sp. SCSIO 43205 TaxID=2779361 RepID=UPI001CA87CB1|nr:DUF4197 domain-containing protein [Erythrobacter sp. SCSIO 43205]UAB78214.1 DUF4197 domain-containing protein [Erythrobacter sp. SCSIO 43205]
MSRPTNRRRFIAGAGMLGIASLMPAAAHAQGLGGLLGGRGRSGLNLSSILGNATDNALDKLAVPGAFYGDEDIRIGLPIIGKLGGGLGGLLGGGSSDGGDDLLGSVLGGAGRLGVLDGITRRINDAAGVAAGEAKPIFREAIDDLSFSDAPGIIRESDGGTQYLRASANDRLHARLNPLVDSALESAGIYKTFDGLAEKHSFIQQAGLNREKINRSVTDQGLDGIFSYIGAEERAFRKNPLGGLLGS